MTARAVVAVAAVLALAWLAVMERDTWLLDRGVRTAGRVHDAADAQRALADFRGARLLNPDSAPDMGRAVVYRGTGRREDAVALVEQVLRREPDNLTAWGQLYGLSIGVDPAAERRALAARARLDPLNARSAR